MSDAAAAGASGGKAQQNLHQPCNILVTGGAGFIASAVVRHLCKEYASYKVVVMDKLDYCANIRNLEEVKRSVGLLCTPLGRVTSAPNCFQPPMLASMFALKVRGMALLADAPPDCQLAPTTHTHARTPAAADRRRRFSHGNFKFVKGDVTSVDLVSYVMESEDIDTVLHFAAQTHVDNSFGNSFAFTENNVVGTHVMLEAAKVRMPKLKRFVHVSTDEVYGENKEGSDEVSPLCMCLPVGHGGCEGAETTAESGHGSAALPFDQAVVSVRLTRATRAPVRCVQASFTEHSSTLDPTNPYSATKACAEMLTKAYSQSYGVPIIVTRGNNVYGPCQYPEKLIPKFLTLASMGRPLPVHGGGGQCRSYL